MAPQPLESVQNSMAMANFVPQAQEGQSQGPRGGSISLAMLIDFIVQRTYHELTVLAELLPRKTDLERKIEIYNFSARTRQLFIRLLALVKWANSASKVDKSAHIMSFLDKQSMLFVETADMLARMARETLVHARLPNFHIPAAVEILTTGTYSRMPACIREKIVPPDPITPGEKRQTLQRLNQVIQHRLVTGKLLPQMRKFRITNGCVKFHVDNEFEVSLSVMGDGSAVPWRLLDINILVEDKETGDGKALVHTLQVNYIHQVIQARLVENTNALDEVYNCLHFFCQSLQLEVLYTQTLRLMIDRLDENIHVDEYLPGSKLTVSYWRELTSKDPKSELGYRLIIQADPTDKARPLAVFHLPSIGHKESVEVADRAVRSEHLSMERLLVHTVYIRSLARLNDVKVEFQTFLKDVDYHLQGTPAMLTIPILHPCLRAEQIHITVDTHTGMLRCHVPKHLDCHLIPELQNALNNDMGRVQHFISELRYWITQRRCEKTLQHLPATPFERLPLLHPPDHPLSKISRHKIYVKFHRHPNIIMVVEIKEKHGNCNEMEYKFYLIYVSHASIEDNVPDKSDHDYPRMYLRVQHLIEFDTFTATHGPGTYMDGNEQSTTTTINCFTELVSSNYYVYNPILEVAGSKRKATGFDIGGSAAKQQKTIYPAYFIPELAHVVAMCDEKLPFISMAQELIKRKIPHSGVQVEANTTSIVLKVLALPEPNPTPPVVTNTAEPQANKPDSLPVIEKAVWNALQKRLLSISIRSQVKNNNSRFWTVELVFFSTPLQTTHHREQGHRRALYFQYELSSTELVARAVDSLLNDWTKIVYLYSLVHEFAEQYKNDISLQNAVVVKSYTYTNLLLGYGPNKELTVSISWCIDTKIFKLIFTGGNSAINAHSMMREQLQSHLNRYYNLAQIVHLLHETYQPLSSIAKLSIIPQLGVPRPFIPVLSFCILPQSPTLLRISYQTMYCMEVRVRGGGLVSIRDGAYSRFDRSKVVEEFTPTQGLKGFLSKYVDETAVYRRQSQSEDDNPPSPIAMEDNSGGPSSVGGSSPFYTASNHRAPQSPRDGGLRFQQPITPPSGSNPHTPASPHPIGQNHPNFNMTSPPGPHMPHPSPSGGHMPSSPLNPQPSPMAHSPGPNLGYMQSHTENSPFTSALSPGVASNWPGSPMPRPSPRPGQSPEHKYVAAPHLSRVIPARSWAGAIPTIISYEALDNLCRPGPHPHKDIPGPELSPLERFLGCVSMRKHLQGFIREEGMVQIPATEPGVVLFKTESLQCQVYLNQANMQSLHIKLSSLPMMPTNDGKQPYQWSSDDLQVIESFFELRVAAPPYRPHALRGFARAISVQPSVLKDFIQLMRLDLNPELLSGLKWNMQFCMRVPPAASPPIIPVGNPAVHIARQKILFFLQLTRAQYMPGMDAWKDATTLVLPLVHVTTSNITQLVERREQATSPIVIAASEQLRRFSEYSVQAHTGECLLFAAVRDLLTNFTLPTDQASPINPQIANQMVSSPAGPVGSSPSPMMHSPMQNTNHPGQQAPPQGYGMAPNQGPN